MSTTSTPEIATYTAIFPNFTELQDYQRLPDFSTQNELYNFNVGVTPRNSMDYLEDYVIVWLARVPPYDGHINVTYRVAILNADGQKCCFQEIPTEYNDMYEWKPVTGGAYIINRDYLTDPTNRMLNNAQLTIVCEVEILNQNLSKVTKQANCCESTNIYEDFGSLLHSEAHSDVVFVVGAKQRTFRLHKAILAARSPVFAAMFEHSELQENRQNRVEITDVEVDVFEELVRFIYTGNAISLKERDYVHELFVASDKYQISSLKEACEQYCMEHLDVETVVETLLVADMHQTVVLKERCLAYIVGHTQEIKNAKNGWKLLKGRPDLLIQVLDLI